MKKTKVTDPLTGKETTLIEPEFKSETEEQFSTRTGVSEAESREAVAALGAGLVVATSGGKIQGYKTSRTSTVATETGEMVEVPAGTSVSFGYSTRQGEELFEMKAGETTYRKYGGQASLTMPWGAGASVVTGEPETVMIDGVPYTQTPVSLTQTMPESIPGYIDTETGKPVRLSDIKGGTIPTAGLVSYEKVHGTGYIKRAIKEFQPYKERYGLDKLGVYTEKALNLFIMPTTAELSEQDRPERQAERIWKETFASTGEYSEHTLREARKVQTRANVEATIATGVKMTKGLFLGGTEEKQLIAATDRAIVEHPKETIFLTTAAALNIISHFTGGAAKTAIGKALVKVAPIASKTILGTMIALEWLDIQKEPNQILQAKREATFGYILTGGLIASKGYAKMKAKGIKHRKQIQLQESGMMEGGRAVTPDQVSMGGARVATAQLTQQRMATGAGRQLTMTRTTQISVPAVGVVPLMKLNERQVQKLDVSPVQATSRMLQQQQQQQQRTKVYVGVTSPVLDIKQKQRLDQAQVLVSAQAQKQIQITTQDTQFQKQLQIQRQITKLTSRRDITITEDKPPPPTPDGGIPIIPIISLPGGGGIGRMQRRMRGRRSRARYTPSIGGLASGRFIHRPPRILTGAETRYPIRRKKRRRQPSHLRLRKQHRRKTVRSRKRR